jgi:hypothetical protein
LHPLEKCSSQMSASSADQHLLRDAPWYDILSYLPSIQSYP